MNGSLKYNSTEIQFTGDIDECLALCESNHKRSRDIKIVWLLSMVMGTIVIWVSSALHSNEIMAIGILLIAFCIFIFPFKDTSKVKTSETKYYVLQAIKNNRIKGIMFRNIEEQESYSNVIFYIEDVKGNIEIATVPSVRIYINTNPKYQDLIEINLDRGFEITHYFYSNLPYNTIFK